MKDPSETKHSCEFCNRTFIKERTLLSHICETKHRWLDKDKQGNRLGFLSFLQFYQKHTINKKQKSYEDFIRSPYYTAFVKFGNYCVGVNCINVSRYTDWLLTENIKLDTWCKDINYTQFLIYYVRNEDAWDAVTRTIEYCMELAGDESIQYQDCFRYANPNKICHAITTGKVSPWTLYQSESGVKFLDNLDNTQVKMVIDYINPELWAIKFKKESDEVSKIKKLMQDAGF